MRKWVNENPGSAIAMAAGALVLALGVIYLTTGGNGTVQIGDTYYHDLETGELFVARRTPGMQESPSGNRAVEAMVYGCGGCDDDQLIVAYLQYEIPPEERPDRMGEMEAVQVSQDGETWAAADSDRAATIMAAPICDNGTRAVRCRPGG